MPRRTIPRLAVAPDTQMAPDVRYGLFSAASVVEDMEPRAFNGVEYTAMCDPGLNLYPLADCAPGQSPTNPPKSAHDAWAHMVADPFALYAADACFPGGGNAVQARDRLRQRILRGERHTVESAIDSGHGGVSPYLRHPDTDLATPGAVPLAEAVGVLEQRMAQAGTTGVIHAPRWTAPLMHALGVKPEGPRMRTLLGTLVAFGSGYSGAPPVDMEDDDLLWLYATGPVTIRRSPIIEPATWAEGAFDPRTNTALLLAERVYVVDWPCHTWAVATTVERPYTPPPPPGPSPSLMVTPTTGIAPLEVEATVGNWGNGPVTLDWGDGTAPVRVDDGASATHTYAEEGEYTVTARSASSTGTPTTARVQVQAPIPSPTGVGWEFTSPTEGGVVWSWEGDPAPERFEVHYRTPPGQGTWSAPLIAQPDDRSVTVQGLTPGAEYEASVVAVTAQGRSEPAVGTGTAPHFPPTLILAPTTGTAPLEVEATVDNHGNGPVTLDWGDGTAPAQVDDGGTATHTYTEGGEYTVTAHPVDVSAPPATAHVQVQAPLAAPHSIGWEFPTPVQGRLVWEWDAQGGPDTTGFEARYRTPPGGGAWSAPLVVEATGRSVDVPDLTPGLEYEAVVEAVNDQDRASSAPVTGTTPPHPDPELTLTPTTGTAPLEVEAAVDNHGLGPVDLQWWEGAQPTQVDDGASATHTYANPGTHTVTATSQMWPQATVSHTVTVTAPEPDPDEE